VEAHGFAPVPEEIWRRNLGIPLRVQFRHFTGDDDRIQAMIETYLEHNLKHHDDMVCQYPGVRRAVESLARAGYRLGVVTSKMHGGLERGLAAGGFQGLFGVLVGADDVENPKPHPEPVLMALDRLGVLPENAYYVGDSPHDMAAGRAAGVRTAAALWGPFSHDDLAPEGPDHWLETPSDIERLFIRVHPDIA
jgi:pyrophosphatase PpaX